MYTLYGTDVSYYSGKARSYLKFKKIPYTEELSTMNAYKKVIIPRTGVRFIPVLITPDDQVIQDTTDIIEQLEKTWPEPSIYPTTPKQRLSALLCELYGDEWMLLPAMHYRWSFKDENYRFIVSEFGKTAFPSLPAFAQRFIGKKIAKKFSGFLPLLGITTNTTPMIQQRYEQLLDQLNLHFDRYPYLFGHRPSIGDFGFIGPLYAHLYRDPYPGAMMKHRAPKVVQWVERMMNPPGDQGSFLENDEVAQPVTDILKQMADDFMPIMYSTIDHVDKWSKQNPDRPIPRSIGSHEFKLGSATESRGIFPNNQWMFQHPWSYYQSLTKAEKESLKDFTDAIGMTEALNRPIPTLLERRSNRLFASKP